MTLASSSSVLILDGGLGSELESQGVDVGATHLWSAELLVSNPSILKSIHRQYLDAGADVITTASYQASVPGFIKYLSENQEKKDKNQISNDSSSHQLNKSTTTTTNDLAIGYIKKSVDIAKEARDEFWKEYQSDSSTSTSSHFTESKSRVKPLVAASIGPYGAFLAHGEEYTGKYGFSVDRIDSNNPVKKDSFENNEGAQILRDFHAPRLEALLDAEPDIIVLETIPSLLELHILCGLLNESLSSRYPSSSFHKSDSSSFQQTQINRDINRSSSSSTEFSSAASPVVWISFSVDTNTCNALADGTPLSQALDVIFRSGNKPQQSGEIEDTKNTTPFNSFVTAVGVNCLPPKKAGKVLRNLSQYLQDIKNNFNNNDNNSNITIPLIVYPNSGEIYNGITKEWISAGTEEDEENDDNNFSCENQISDINTNNNKNNSNNNKNNNNNKQNFYPFLKDWYNSGARIIGGCCRTRPKDIQVLRSQIYEDEILG